jgi:hypothetical protein
MVGRCERWLVPVGCLVAWLGAGYGTSDAGVSRAQEAARPAERALNPSESEGLPVLPPEALTAWRSAGPGAPREGPRGAPAPDGAGTASSHGPPPGPTRAWGSP